MMRERVYPLTEQISIAICRIEDMLLSILIVCDELMMETWTIAWIYRNNITTHLVFIYLRLIFVDNINWNGPVDSF